MINDETKEIIDRYSKMGKIGNRGILEKVPISERNYKCHTCKKIVDTVPCPECGEMHLEIMCPLDHCHCIHEIVGTHAYCPICGEPVCPECGSHDVSQISRVTGYLADVDGFNEGKKQELKDRMRYNDL
jgi:hypothetical protein